MYTVNVGVNVLLGSRLALELNFILALPLCLHVCLPQGGYNLTSISESMSMCTSTLLGDSLPLLPPLPPPHLNAAVTINRVLRSHALYWSSLRIQSEWEF